MTKLDAQTARRIVVHLKAGTTPIDCVEHINVGNERWYAAAEQQFDEVGADGDALVRFIDGYYGDGKTHFMGMLRAIAFRKQWMVSYVSAEFTPLNKFDVVYAEIVRNLSLPPQWSLPPWLLSAGVKGAHALLASIFATFYAEAYRSPDSAGLHKERVLEGLREKAATLAAQPELVEPLGRAVLAYVEAVIRGDRTTRHAVCSWLAGGNERIPEAGLRRRIDQAVSRDVMRGISVLARRGGASGVLILLDEAERILTQSRAVRNRSYGVIRDLLDNADDQGGMQASIIYIAATPEMFQSAKGFPEYDALRSRLAQATHFTLPALTDWRGVIVDLSTTALPHDALVTLVYKIVDLHAMAYGWDARAHVTDEVVKHIVDRVEGGAFIVSKPRLLASYTATILEVIEQNRDQSAISIADKALSTVQSSLSAQAETTDWE